jgi:predicted metal-dependent phosphoesterase TrpH
MTPNDTQTIRVELHAHTQASKDSLVRPERLIEHCAKIGIDRIAITDHNEIKGAFAARDLAPERVIVGEEIETTQGELIGYFMQEWVPPGLTPMEAIEMLRAQGAVISVAHPFDTVRSKHWREADLLEIAPHIDAIEVFNARCLRDAPNQQAAVFAKQHGLLATVGSDAHSLFEVGRASLVLPHFEGAEGFRKALADARPIARLSPAFVHLFSRFASFYKRIKN